MNTNTEHFNHRVDSMAAHKVDLSFHRTQENKKLTHSVAEKNLEWWKHKGLMEI
jgi:hypothetical protein